MKKAYEDGINAAKAGEQIWKNPHKYGDSTKEDYHQWQAGWCVGMDDQLDHYWECKEMPERDIK
jgi:hypothetical protein